MNHQQPNRKTFSLLAKDPVVRTPLPQAKVAEDSNGRRRNRSKSKNKIPKSVRYDLENALVSLCDVWFEDIKPHLLRNNIKVHAQHAAHGEAGKGDEGGAAGDNCPHLDPASSASSCELCRLLFNAANSIQSAVSQAACVAVSNAGSDKDLLSFSNSKFLVEARSLVTCRVYDTSPPHVHHLLQDESSCRKRRDSSEPKQRKRRRRRPASDPQHLPPQRPPPHLHRTYYIVPDMTCTKVTNATQCPEIRNKRNISPVSNNRVLAPVSITKKKHTTTQTDVLREPERGQEQKFDVYSKTFGRRNATTTLFQTQRKGKSHEISPLFQNDLVNIIADKHEKRLQLLYKCAAFSNGDASTMNLMPSSTAVPKKPLQKKPWR